MHVASYPSTQVIASIFKPLSDPRPSRSLRDNGIAPSQNRQRAGEATPTNLSPRELRTAAAGPRDGSSPSLHQGGNVITVAVAAQHGSPAAAAAGIAAADAAPAPGGQGCLEKKQSQFMMTQAC